MKGSLSAMICRRFLWSLGLLVLCVGFYVSLWDHFLRSSYLQSQRSALGQVYSKEESDILFGEIRFMTPSSAFLRPCSTDLSQVRQRWPPFRQQMQIKCDSSDVEALSINVSSTYDVINLRGSEGTECLQKFVQKFCYSSSSQKVPNIVHYVWFGDQVFQPHNLVSVLSAVRYQAPCAILFHGDTLPKGDYWRLLRTLVPNVIRVYLPAPKHVFGKNIMYIQHKADVARIKILTDLGGIYLDTDQLMLRHVNDLRGHACVMSHENWENLANSFILAQPNADFLLKWSDQYRSYNPAHWGYHSTFVPWKIAKRNPTLIKVVGNKFVYPDLTRGAIKRVYYSRDYDISQNYGLHLYTRWTAFNFTLTSAAALNSTLGDVWRTVLFGTSRNFRCSN